MITTRQLMDELRERLSTHPEKTAGLTVTYQFNIEGEGGGTWHLRIVDGTAEVAEGPTDKPDMTTILSASDYVAMATGQVSGRELFFSGRMSVLGNPMLGMQLNRITN